MSEAPRAGSIAASLAADGAEPDAKFAFLKPPAEGGGTAASRRAKVIDFLKARDGHVPASAAEVRAATGVDLAAEAALHRDLLANPNVRVEQPAAAGGGFAYAYEAALAFITSADALLAHVARAGTRPVRARDVADCYAGVRADVEALVRSGELIAIKARECCANAPRRSRGRRRVRS